MLLECELICKFADILSDATILFDSFTHIYLIFCPCAFI